MYWDPEENLTFSKTEHKGYRLVSEEQDIAKANSEGKVALMLINTAISDYFVYDDLIEIKETGIVLPISKIIYFILVVIFSGI